jgi:hypothetical protein
MGLSTNGFKTPTTHTSIPKFVEDVVVEVM